MDLQLKRSSKGRCIPRTAHSYPSSTGRRVSPRRLCMGFQAVSRSRYTLLDYPTTDDTTLDLNQTTLSTGAGWSMLDNVIVCNGTIFIVSNTPSQFPPLTHMFSTGVPMSSDPASWAGKDATDREMRIVSTEVAKALFGDYGSRIEGVSFLCNDDMQCESSLCYMVGET